MKSIYSGLHFPPSLYWNHKFSALSTQHHREAGHESLCLKSLVGQQFSQIFHQTTGSESHCVFRNNMSYPTKEGR